jgi:hypothetical protein
MVSKHEPDSKCSRDELIGGYVRISMDVRICLEGEVPFEVVGEAEIDDGLNQSSHLKNPRRTVCIRLPAYAIPYIA